MKVLIDGDSLVYTIGFACQKNIWQAIDPEEGIVYYENEIKSLVLGFIEDNPELGVLDLSHRIEVSPESHAFHSVKLVVQKIAQRARANSYKIYLTGEGNFREWIATVMGYKHNRKDKPKPILYQSIRDYLVNTHKATVVNGMEADDALSIVYTRSVDGNPVNVSKDPNHKVMKYPEECIIAAIDKDLRNIPGKHINFDKRVAENDEYKFVIITESEGRRTFWKQMLTGDSSDNILGLPMMGPKRADELLSTVKEDTDKGYFDVVYGAYKKHYGLDPFEYYRYDAYTDTTQGFTKRELKPEEELLPEQKLVGTALTMLLENARLLWMIRTAPNAEGTHWWMPPYTFEEIAAMDATEREALPDRELDEPFSEGRGKWFYYTMVDGIAHKYGPFGTKKKAAEDIKNPACNHEPGEDCPKHPMTEENQIPVSQEQSDVIDASVSEVVTADDLVTEPVDSLPKTKVCMDEECPGCPDCVPPYFDKEF